MSDLYIAFDLAGQQFEPAIDHHDQRRLEKLEQTLVSQPGTKVVAELGGAVVGTVLGFVEGNAATLRLIGVVAEHRRNGLGSDLVRMFEKGAAALGATEIYLGAENAAPFYQRLGYGRGEMDSASTLMSRSLRPPSHLEGRS